ncbi:MAG: hypothetical protein JWM93_1795 [Frankiales bacterium]|nr:hypothetical protein [Frankiales bacterium]
MTRTLLAQPKRWASAAVVASLTAATVSLSGGSAFAATPATNVAFISGQASTVYTTSASGFNTTFEVALTPSSSDSPVSMAVISGPDADDAGNGTFAADASCDASNPTDVICDTANLSLNATLGKDVIRVFADNNGSGISTGQPSVDFTLVKSGPVYSLTIAPLSANSAAGTAASYTATVLDQATNAVPGAAVKIEVTGTAAFAPVVTNTTGAPDTTGNATAGWTVKADDTADANGLVKFDVTGNGTGNLLVRVYSDKDDSLSYTAGDPTATATQSVSAGGEDAVTSLVLTPSTDTQYTGVQQVVNYALKNAAGVAIQGVTPSFLVTGANAVGESTCSQSIANGTGTCAYTGATAGTDTVKVWVNRTVGSPLTSGADTGEQQGTVTRIYAAAPPISVGNSSVKCLESLATASPSEAGTQVAHSCTLPVDKKTETFQATVKNAAGTALSGVIVSWSTTAAATGDTITTSSTTDANGVATATQTIAGTPTGTYTVTAKVGTTTVDTRDVTYQTRDLENLVLTPYWVARTFGSSATFTATETDQFGAAMAGRSVMFTNDGSTVRNPIPNTTKTTDANGQATITITDSGVSSSSNYDSLRAKDVLTGQFDQGASGTNGAYVVWYANANAAAVAIDANAGAVDFAAGSNNSAVGLSPAQRTVYVRVTAADGTTQLDGKLVTLSLSAGKIVSSSDANVSISADGKTAVATTGWYDTGIVGFVVESTVSGPLGLTATADGINATGVLTVDAPAVSAARNILVTPLTDATVALEAGDLKNVRFKVTDGFGNGVPGVLVNFNNAGAGFFFGGTNSASATTNTDGIASVAVTSLSSSYGASTVTATIATSGTQCTALAGAPNAAFTAGNCATTAQIQWSPLPTIGGTTVRTGTGSVRITGVVAPGVSVALMQGSVQVATTTSNATTGVYAFTRTISTTTSYTVKAGGLSSGVFKVTVKFLAKLTLSVKAHKVTARVAIGPKVSNVEIRFYVRTNGVYKYAGHVRTDANGIARKTFTNKAGTTYYYGAMAVGNYGRSSSKLVYAHITA